jgi:hypothetical protein
VIPLFVLLLGVIVAIPAWKDGQIKLERVRFVMKNGEVVRRP